MSPDELKTIVQRQKDIAGLRKKQEKVFSEEMPPGEHFDSIQATRYIRTEQLS